ncbi:MAG: glycerol-3-phosphate dehydrogenase/oxidase [Bdellovibrio sp.]|jgi:glycerol-3-phosphate dehydrogenase
MTDTFSFKDRTLALNDFSSREFDLVIIGGGINGAGAARDAVLRGMKVALIEASDFASGTSSRSSKLVHGGIRYLENLEFHLVFEALNERTRLFQMAPHLVHPLRFMMPLYQGGRVGMFKMGLGMWLYDALSLFEAPEMHERLNAKQCFERQPLLQQKELLGSYVYSDAYMDDDRLVFETLRSARGPLFACANYVRAIGAEFSTAVATKNQVAPQVVGVKCRDEKTGKTFSIRGRHVLSTVGPWTDELGEQLFKKWNKVLRPTKGVHLTFEKKRFPLSSAVVMGAESRVVFGIPRHEMVIVGTTDTDFQGDPAKVSTTTDDVKYLLSVVDKYFPGAKLTDQDIVATYAGVRPLVKDASESEGKTSREHTIWTNEDRVTFVAGGKYTTYRLISEQAVDHCLKHFSIEDRVQYRAGPSASALNPLVTLDSIEQNPDRKVKIRQKTQLSDEEATWLVDRHGGEADVILERYGFDLTYWEYEALHAIDQTMCLHLVDFFTRRVPLVLSRADHGASLIEVLLPLFSTRLAWSSETAQKEVQALEAYVEHEFAWRKSFDSR